MDLTIRGWKMTAPGALTAFEEKARDPEPGQVLVEVAGCGVCHTDLSYLYGGVPTRKPLPLTLGHEIAGVVVATGKGAEKWQGHRVLVPAVSPCGTCRFCTAGRATSCIDGKMPGNHTDGGFASHAYVPAATLCPVDPNGNPVALNKPIGKAELALWELAVVADAVTTPLQAIRRCGVHEGHLAVVVGVGGVGVHAVQIARHAGAQVAAIDVDPVKLERARSLGAGLTLNAKDGVKPLKTALAKFAEQTKAQPDGWRIFETSGTKAGQELAFSLLTRGGTLSVVGFTPEPATVRLSNLMALDATAYGNWGCDPELYPTALALVASGAVRLRGLVRKEPLSKAPEILEAVHHGQIQERVVLVPT